MDENQDENVHFRMRLDEDVDDDAGPTQVGDLRIEKLNHRITFIGILTPILIIIILTVAYLDIKRRVIQTEDSGAATAQNLTEDVESRFSTLSLKQARFEEALNSLQDQTNQSIAKAQVALKKLDESLKHYQSVAVSQKEMKSTAHKIEMNMANLSKSIDDIRTQVDTATHTFQSRMGEMGQEVTGLASRFNDLHDKMTDLEQTKIDKAALDLALKLETLKTKQLFNMQLDEIRSQIKSAEQKISRLNARQHTSAPASSPPKAAPKATSTAPVTPAPPGDDLQEQTIKP